MRVLVTGGSGLVGKGIEAVADSFPELQLILASSSDGDLRKEEDVDLLIQKHAPLDGVIHLAANVGGLFKNMNYPVQMLEDNLIMNTNILKVAHKHNINHVLCFLSTCIFPDKPPAYPITSDMLHEGPPHPSNEGYALAKRMQEVQCRAYQKQYGRRYFCVVPTNIYGPHDNFHLEDAHVVPALIHKCYLAKKNNTPFVVGGDGSPLRQFIHSHDVARLVLWAFTNYQDISRPLILCPPDAEVSIATIVNYIAEALEFKENVSFDTSKPNGQFKKTADAAHLESLLHGVVYTPLETGIKEATAWFVDAYERGEARV
jgi:GDP-L-fucose synthase